MDTDRKPFQRDIQSIEMAKFLKTFEIGQTVPYEKFESRGFKVQTGKGRGHLATALKELRERDNIFYLCVHTVGYARVTPEEFALAESESSKRRAENLARNTEKKLSAVNMDELSDSARKIVMVSQTQLGLIKHFASNKAQKVIEGHIVPANGKLTLGKTLELFR